MNQYPPIEMPETASVRAQRLGRNLDRIDSAARTDVGADGERHVYRSGTTIYSGHYDAVGGAWRYVAET